MADESFPARNGANGVSPDTPRLTSSSQNSAFKKEEVTMGDTTSKKPKSIFTATAKEPQALSPAPKTEPQLDSSLARTDENTASATKLKSDTQTGKSSQSGGATEGTFSALFVPNTPDNVRGGQFVYPQTDLGNAQMFYRLYNKFFMYGHESGEWFGWDNDKQRWLTGKLAYKVMMRLVKKLVTELYRQAQSRRHLRTRNDETVKPGEALAWAKSTSQKGRQKAMFELVRDMPRVRVSKAELDNAPYLLGVANGVLDLRTGTLIENRPELLITRYAKAAYRPGAEAPTFQRFMDEICLGRQDLMDFLQEVFGYALSGLIKEHAFFLLLGTGANGKSTLVEIFLYLLSDYGIGMPGHAFLKSNSRAIPNDIARLLGIRYATSAELNSDTSADESTLKRLSSGDVVTARFIGKEYFDFHPQAKFFLSVNTLPKITGADNGIYRRLVVIPFDGDFQATMDRDLPEKLQAEIDGILAWAVQGFLRWHERGHLVQPNCVVEACKAYRAEMDTVQSFLDECCILDPKAKTPLGVLYEAYQNWAKGAVVDPAKMQLFGTLMGQKGFKKKKSGPWRWLGVALKDTPKSDGTVSPFGAAMQPQPTPAATDSSSTGLPQ